MIDEAAPVVAESGPLTATPPTPDWTATIPEKFRVVGADGAVSLNGEATLKSYLHLEQRQSKHGAIVDNADSYTRPDGMDDAAWGSEEIKGLREKAIENGMTDKQWAFMAAENARIAESVASEMTPSIDQARVDFLAFAGGDEAKMAQNLGLAQKAAKAYGFDMANPYIGNSAQVLAALSKIGAELGSDGSVAGAVLSGSDLQSLRSNPAYMDERHPEHRIIRDRVRQHYVAAAARK